MISDYFQKQDLSLYQPSSEVQQLTKYGQEAYLIGNRILTQSWPELNDMTVIDRDNRDKKTFNAFVDENVDDPKEAWKWRGTRSAARKKALDMHAYLTSGFMFPMVGAQDENNDEDRGVGDFMRNLIIWMGDNSNYRSSFLQVVMGMLTSPVTYMGAEYATIMQKIKVKTQNGYTTKEILDDELSGFQAPVYSCSDILITNAYVQNIQRQTCVIKQRYLDYHDAEKKYGKHENWNSVQRGVNCVLNEDNGLFYDVYDADNSELVKETICMWRGEDLEVPFLGGVYMGDDNTDWNRMKHRDNFNSPKYDIVPFGFHRISEHFFFYKSLMNSLGWDDQLIDAMYENVMNNEFLNQNLPIVVTGEDDVNTSIMFPGAQFVTANKDTKVQTVAPPQRSDGYRALQIIEESIKEASLSDTASGQLPEASQKAFSVAKADQNSRIILKGVGQSLGESIVQHGKLMVNIAINHLSTAQIEEVAGNARSIKYRKFVLPSQSKGKNITKVLKYGGDLVGKTMSKEEEKMYAVGLYEEAGGKEENKSIMIVNPKLASRMKYLIRFDAEEMFSEDKESRQKLLGQLYTLWQQNPYVDLETLTRKMAYAMFRSEGDELLKQKSDIEQMMQQGKPATGVPMEEKTKMEKLKSLAGV